MITPLVWASLVAALLAAPPAAPEAALLGQWNAVEKGVRDGTMPEAEARKTLHTLLPALQKAYAPQVPASDWVFPVEGGRRAWIGGKTGEGYRPNAPRPGYTFYEGNKHGGHPAHDVFIPQDRNRDCRHDKRDTPYPAIAMQAAVVLSINHDWKPGQPRGGKYVWMYAPTLDLLIYYAHLDELVAKVGQVVQPGDRLGTVGKTGFPAHKANKPCHIHLMVLKGDQGVMRPVNWFDKAPKKRGGRIHP